MADETRDLSKHEHLVICIRWVDDKLEAREDFIGLQKLERSDASFITALIKDCLIRMNLSIHKVRGQCYDGCSTMSGVKTGVATQTKKSGTQCLYCHCYGHSLNLACMSLICYEALDLIVSLIKDRFNQRDYSIYMNCEQLLLKAAAGGDAYKNEFQTVTSFYGSHFDSRELEAYLSTFTHNIPRVENVTLVNVLAYLAIVVFTPATAVVTGHQISQTNYSHASYKRYQ